MNLELLQLIPIKKTSKLLNICHQKTYDEINDGRLKTVKIGRRRFTTPKFLQEYIELLEKESLDALKA